MSITQLNTPIEVETIHGLAELMFIRELGPNEELAFLVVMLDGKYAGNWLCLGQNQIKSTKRKEPISPLIESNLHKVLYAVGILKGPDSYAMINGPNPSMDDMVDSMQDGEYLFRLVDGQITPIGYQRSNKFVSC